LSFNGKGAGSPDKGALLCWGRSPEQKTLDVVAGWNKPAKPSAEETVGRLRKPEGGTKRGRESSREVDAFGDAAKRDETLAGVARD
jgi:hypothetical protein